MQPIEPTPRYTVEQQWDTAVITTSPRQDGATITKIIIGLPFWLVFGCFAVAIATTVVPAVFEAVAESAACLRIGVQILSVLFVASLLVNWTIYGLTEVGWLLWQLEGKEVISLGPETITIQMQLSFFTYTRVYLLEHIRFLRVKKHEHTYAYLKDFKRTITLYLVAFDYQGKTIHFGFSTPLDENKQIAQLTREHYPRNRHLQTFNPEVLSQIHRSQHGGE